MNDDKLLLERHNLLKALREQVFEWIGKGAAKQYEWDWAGDGGIFAFPANIPDRHTPSKVFLVAKKIWEELPAFNAAHKSDLQLRIVIDRGEAYYYEVKELRRGPALNFAAKVRVPGKRTSITVTRQVVKDIECEPAIEFRRRNLDEPFTVTVYGYAPALRKALEYEVELVRSADPIQAAHFAYRLGVLNFGTANLIEARKALTSAVELMEAVDPEVRHRYYFRTMLTFYRLWLRLATDISSALVADGDGDDRRKLLRSESFKAFFEKHVLGSEWDLIPQMEFVLEQFDLLAHRPLSDPIGMTGMLICLLLERIGYPRRWYGAAISERIERIKSEMRECRGTIDDECSICTAVAASCLALDHDDRSDELVKWLKTLGGEVRYCYRGDDLISRAPNTEHALHYAACVFQAMLDHDAVGNNESVRDVMSHFFDGSASVSDNLPESWRRYRNVSPTDLSSYILPAFARAGLAHWSFDDRQKASLQDALKVLTKWSVDAAGDASIPDSPERVYASRENLGSFALGWFVGFPPGAKPIVDRMMKKLFDFALRDELKAVHRNRTIDSSLDRVRKLFDGLLLQWECELYVRDMRL